MKRINAVDRLRAQERFKGADDHKEDERTGSGQREEAVEHRGSREFGKVFRDMHEVLGVNWRGNKSGHEQIPRMGKIERFAKKKCDREPCDGWRNETVRISV